MHCLKPQSRPKKAKLDIWLWRAGPKIFGVTALQLGLVLVNQKYVWWAECWVRGIGLLGLGNYPFIFHYQSHILPLLLHNNMHKSTTLSSEFIHRYIFVQQYSPAGNVLVSDRQPKGSYHFYFSENHQQSPQMPLKICFCFLIPFLSQQHQHRWWCTFFSSLIIFFWNFQAKWGLSTLWKR